MEVSQLLTSLYLFGCGFIQGRFQWLRTRSV